MVMNTAQLKELSTTSYWDTRYTVEQQQQRDKDKGSSESTEQGQEEREYEWFRTFDQIKPFLEQHLPSASSSVRILQLGCGTSVSDLTIRYQRALEEKL